MTWGLLDEQFGGFGRLFVDMITAELVDADRKKMTDAVMDWLKGPARKKNIPDLQERLQNMGSRVENMMKSIRFAVRDKEIVVIADGSGEDTLRAFANGTDWFEPCDDIVSIMISALRNS